jgi:hypothetical protein
MLLAATDYPLLNLFWTTFIIFGWILWFWLLIRVYSDMFRRPDMSGLAKTGWVVFTLLVPFIGVLVYLISQGRAMQERAERRLQEHRAATDAYIRSVATDADTVQMAKARDLLQSGAITSDEFDRMVGNARPGPASASEGAAATTPSSPGARSSGHPVPAQPGASAAESVADEPTAARPAGRLPQ